MSTPITGRRTLEPMGPAGGFIFTDDEVVAMGEGAKVFPVLVTVNGHDLPLRLARMGGVNCVGIRQELRKQADLALGETYEITIRRDHGERTIAVPIDLRAALDADPAVGAAFDALAPTHRKEFVRWVEEAKREATRSTRIEKTVVMVREGQTR